MTLVTKTKLALCAAIVCAGATPTAIFILTDNPMGWTIAAFNGAVVLVSLVATIATEAP
jgi:hypothetical protein